MAIPKVTEPPRTPSSAQSVVVDTLDQLVHQFADPLACLRELIQNAIDAGSLQVDITLSWHDEVATLQVADSGCGMTRAIIETRLTRLFASDKFGDHTKIGRFGVGFVSVFALAPDAVCVDTGREGASWRLLFARDRSYELRALPQPVEGTTVRILKTLPAAGFDALRRDAIAAVRRWCRHVQCEIRVDGTLVNEPFDLPEAPLRCRVEHPLGVFVLGHRADGRGFHGLYNTGLTLLEGDGEWLPGLAIKVSSPRLEHTLTRDTVIVDRAYASMRAVAERVAREQLAAVAVAHLAELAVPTDGDASSEGLDYACDAVSWHLRRHGAALPRAAARRPCVPTPAGHLLSLRQLRARQPGRTLLLARGRSPLTDALEQAGRTVVWIRSDRHEALVRAAAREDVAVVWVRERWCLPGPRRAPNPAQAQLFAHTLALLRGWGARVRSVELGDVEDPESGLADAVAVVRRPDHRPVPLTDARVVGTSWLRRRVTLAIQGRHALVQELAALAQVRPGLAAHLLIKAFWLGAQLDPRRDGELARAAMELR